MTTMSDVAQIYLDKFKWVSSLVWRRRWLALCTSIVVALVCFAGLRKYDNHYKATARIFVATQSVLKPLMAGLAYQPDIDQQVSMLARTLISRPNVERLLKRSDFMLGSADAASHDDLVTKLMEQIKIVPAGPNNYYEITYGGTNPDQSRRLVESTVAMFISTGSVAKKEDSEDAGRFIEDQIHAYEAKLVEAENRLKDFKLRNFGVSGVSNQDHFLRLSLLSDEVTKTRLELTSAEQARDAFRHELAGEDPQLPAEPGSRSSVSAVAEVEARLEAQRKQLDDLLRRFTDAHPDVVSAQRTIAQLEIELKRRRDEAARAAASGSVGRAATSPVYQKLRVSLAEADARVASLRAQLGSQQAQLNEARAVAGRVPQVEAELAQLNRDYDVIRKNYEQLVARRESARLGVKLDESSQLAEFRLVEPPRVSSSPMFPSRLHLAMISVLASLVAGALVAVGAEAVRPTIHSVAVLQRLTGRPLAGSVSVLSTPELARERRAATMRFASAAGVLLILQCAWLIWIGLQSHR
jgi:polysaccharide chain length determinant protein (PEP-CTERM system associated)